MMEMAEADEVKAEAADDGDDDHMYARLHRVHEGVEVEAGEYDSQRATSRCISKTCTFGNLPRTDARCNLATHFVLAMYASISCGCIL